MENIILQKKLMFYHHLSNLPVNSLAGEVFRIQKENNEEGIITECSEHLLRIGNPNPLEDSKRVWKAKISKYIVQKNKMNYWTKSKHIKNSAMKIYLKKSLTRSHTSPNYTLKM